MRLHHLIPMLNVAELGRSLDFYRDALGFHLVSDPGMITEWCRATVRSGQCELTLAQTGLAPALVAGRDPHADAGWPTVLYFYPDDVHALHARLQSADYKTTALIDTVYGMREFSMTDPDGHILSFGQDLDEVADPGRDGEALDLEAGLRIRRARPADREAIVALHSAAFPSGTESALVDRILAGGEEALSCVACAGPELAGHVLYTPVSIERRAADGAGRARVDGAEGPDGATAAGAGATAGRGVGLAPLAVLPRLQRRGIGASLLVTSLSVLRDRGCPFVVVLGDPAFYGRFGFRPAADHGLECAWPVPPGAFMVRLLGREAPRPGRVSYLPAFMAPEDAAG